MKIISFTDYLGHNFLDQFWSSYRICYLWTKFCYFVCYQQFFVYILMNLRINSKINFKQIFLWKKDPLPP